MKTLAEQLIDKAIAEAKPLPVSGVKSFVDKIRKLEKKFKGGADYEKGGSPDNFWTLTYIARDAAEAKKLSDYVKTNFSNVSKAHFKMIHTGSKITLSLTNADLLGYEAAYPND